MKKTNEVCLSEYGMTAADAYQKITRELDLDGDPCCDLGSYTSIRMHPEANEIVSENMAKNLINQHEYPQTTAIHQKLVEEIADLLHAPCRSDVLGCSTSGSSEAIAIAMLAHKWSWLNRKDRKGSPNIVICSNAHLCWRKFALYFRIDVREVALTEPGLYPLQQMMDQVDHNTICVVAVLGSTYTGFCDPIEVLNDALMCLNKSNGWNIGIHVDGAIGGFVLPFLDQSSQPLWDFSLPLVRSINLSGHKFGLVYPGLGWLIFRNKALLSEQLSLKSSYLSGDSQSFAITFSRSASLVLAQYFNFLYYGRNGYRQVMEKCLRNANYFANKLIEIGLFELVCDLRLPVVTFCFKRSPDFNETEFTEQLRVRGWMLPCYQMPVNIRKTVMRVVVREDMTKTKLLRLVKDMEETYSSLL